MPLTHRLGVGAAVPAAAVLVVVGGGWLIQVGLNPVGDEWHCSAGKAPAHNSVGGSDCFREGSDLPRGWSWDRWGNRPLHSNCDRNGWVAIEDRAGDLTDCVRTGTRLPDGWRRSQLGS